MTNASNNTNTTDRRAARAADLSTSIARLLDDMNATHEEIMGKLSDIEREADNVREFGARFPESSEIILKDAAAFSVLFDRAVKMREELTELTISADNFDVDYDREAVAEAFKF